jgi:hypothetical protein
VAAEASLAAEVSAVEAAVIASASARHAGSRADQANSTAEKALAVSLDNQAAGSRADQANSTAEKAWALSLDNQARLDVDDRRRGFLTPLPPEEADAERSCTEEVSPTDERLRTTNKP